MRVIVIIQIFVNISYKCYGEAIKNMKKRKSSETRRATTEQL